MNCDHDNCKTAFCPTCGERVGLDGLLGLLAHIITSIKNKKSRRKSMDRDLERAGTDEKQWNNKVYWAKCIKSNEEAIVRWERWKELLTKAIEKGEDR